MSIIHNIHAAVSFILRRDFVFNMTETLPDMEEANQIGRIRVSVYSLFHLNILKFVKVLFAFSFAWAPPRAIDLKKVHFHNDNSVNIGLHPHTSPPMEAILTICTCSSRFTNRCRQVPRAQDVGRSAGKELVPPALQPSMYR